MTKAGGGGGGQKSQKNDDVFYSIVKMNVQTRCGFHCDWMRSEFFTGILVSAFSLN